MIFVVLIILGFLGYAELCHWHRTREAPKPGQKKQDLLDRFLTWFANPETLLDFLLNMLLQICILLLIAFVVVYLFLGIGIPGGE